MNILLLYGGRSSEHEVSISSATNFLKGLKQNQYDTYLVKILQDNTWIYQDDQSKPLEHTNPKGIQVCLAPIGNKVWLIEIQSGKKIFEVNLVAPIMHGQTAEDGAIQGLCEFYDIAYIGPGILASATSFNKLVTKELVSKTYVNQAKYLALTRLNQISELDIVNDLGLPAFIKPASLGSSVGVSKVTDKAGLSQAIKTALSYDNQVLIEEAIDGREVECAILGNSDPIASPTASIITKNFYDYQTKYHGSNPPNIELPSEIDPEIEARIKSQAIEIFRVLGCKGMSRVDFFLTKNNQIIFNEINTIPGFTQYSMYPKMIELLGIDIGQLTKRLVELALTAKLQRQSLSL
ncbi:D-alanine--D-alanine ligase [Candidatus Saccharibacteria bacterium]|nr:D-alanine--D-alanine ligase [Candidatus Saccharibacteria bacterium]